LPGQEIKQAHNAHTTVQEYNRGPFNKKEIIITLSKTCNTITFLFTCHFPTYENQIYNM